MNKAIIIILVLLLVVTGGMGYYSFDLGKQIAALSDELTTFRGDTATQIGTLSGELTTFRGDTNNQIGTLSDELATFRGDTNTQVSTLSDELTTFRGETTTKIDSLGDELEGVSSEVSQSVINVSKLYEKVRSGVVEVYVEEGGGSGFVFDAEGHIVTNYHVVEEATTVDVVLYDGTVFRASVIGFCKYSDIAVLKLSGEVGIEPLELADSSTLTIGEPVIAIGSPFNLTETVTSGIVSQEGRFETYTREKPYYTRANLIQYSAASNPGNSGGPLLNSKGEVIGMVTAGVSPSAGEGIFYAISSNKVERVVRSLIDHGFFNNPTLPGQWTLEDLTPEKARAKNFQTTDGILIAAADSAAVFETNDTIVAIDEISVRSVADLFNYIGEYGTAGVTVKLTLIRNGAKIGKSVTLVEGGVVTSDEGYQPFRE